MVKATITSKGQLTIPKRVRDDLGLVTGDHVGFVADGRGSYKLKPIRTRSSAQGVCDRLVKPGAHASVEDMERAGLTPRAPGPGARVPRSLQARSGRLQRPSDRADREAGRGNHHLHVRPRAAPRARLRLAPGRMRREGAIA